MTVYTDMFTNITTWGEPIETIWQCLSGSPKQSRQRRMDLGLSERLFIGAVMNQPRGQRPWGIVTWLGNIYQTSRPTLYHIGQQMRESQQTILRSDPHQKVRVDSGDEVQWKVSDNRLKRTILTLTIPGKVSGRNIADCLNAAFDLGRSNGYVSMLLHEAGRKAGEVLDRVDHSGLGAVTLARDEIFRGRSPNLLLVEPHTLTITGAYATNDREAETWGCALLLTQGRGVQIQGLAEDGCIPYDASCRMAELDAAIQRDVWHTVQDAHQVVMDVERDVLRAIVAIGKLEKRLTTKRWQEETFQQWVSQTEQAERLLVQSGQARFWYECLWDAMEIVDWRSGEIRDRAINGWLLDEILIGLGQINHPRVQKLVERLTEQKDELLTFLDGLAPQLETWQARLAHHFTNPVLVSSFQSTVARVWRLEHAIRNGHSTFASTAAQAKQHLTDFVVDDPVAHDLAQDLLTLLERVVRTSCAVEAVNSVLRPFLESRRECTDQTSRQLFLNLFTLWFNLHKFERGPRAGKSPYQLAGIDLGSEDWITVLGYPPD
jgi:hypothetical protein